MKGEVIEPRRARGNATGDALEAARNELRADLLRIASEPQRRLYAVLDGALFEDLPGRLARDGLDYRSLYVGVDDASLVAAGPWLVDPTATVPSNLGLNEPDDPSSRNSSDEELVAEAAGLAARMRAALEAGDESGAGMLPVAATPDRLAARIATLTDMLAGRPNAGVFWIGGADLTSDRMWRHARSLNRIMIPRQHADEAWDTPTVEESGVHPTDPVSASQAAGARDPSHVDVMFRHADGNVLAEIMPHLTEHQFARVLGPADAVMFVAPGHPSERSGSPLRRAVRPGARASGDLLRLTGEQMLAVENARESRYHLANVQYLENVAPNDVEGCTKAELLALSRRCETSGDAMELRTVSSHRKWLYLNLVTDEHFNGNERGVAEFLRTHPSGAEVGMDEMMSRFTAELERLEDEASATRA